MNYKNRYKLLILIGIACGSSHVNCGQREDARIAQGILIEGARIAQGMRLEGESYYLSVIEGSEITFDTKTNCPKISKILESENEKKVLEFAVSVYMYIKSDIKPPLLLRKIIRLLWDMHSLNVVSLDKILEDIGRRCKPEDQLAASVNIFKIIRNLTEAKLIQLQGQFASNNFNITSTIQEILVPLNYLEEFLKIYVEAQVIVTIAMQGNIETINAAIEYIKTAKCDLIMMQKPTSAIEALGARLLLKKQRLGKEALLVALQTPAAASRLSESLAATPAASRLSESLAATPAAPGVDETSKVTMPAQTDRLPVTQARWYHRPLFKYPLIALAICFLIIIVMNIINAWVIPISMPSIFSFILFT